MVDSCVALNTMYLPFGMYLCKEYPWLLSAVYGSKGHHSNYLSGIVKDDKAAIITELPVAFVFKTAYTTVRNAILARSILWLPDLHFFSRTSQVIKPSSGMTIRLSPWGSTTFSRMNGSHTLLGHMQINTQPVDNKIPKNVFSEK